MLELALNAKINSNANNKPKIIIQLDNKKYQHKPIGAEIAKIKSRTQRSEPKEVTIKQFAKILSQGVSYSPGILKEGLSAKNWVQQQVFPVDIDNDNQNIAILFIKDALKICSEKDIKPDLYYESFSSTAEKPKYRLVFVTDKPIKSEDKRLFIIETLISLFPQADISCKNADRIFFATNKEVHIL